jgi:hypothetical protein
LKLAYFERKFKYQNELKKYDFRKLIKYNVLISEIDTQLRVMNILAKRIFFRIEIIFIRILKKLEKEN